MLIIVRGETCTEAYLATRYRNIFSALSVEILRFFIRVNCGKGLKREKEVLKKTPYRNKVLNAKRKH